MAIQILKRKKGIVYRASAKTSERPTKCFDRKYDAKQWLEQQEHLASIGCSRQLTFAEAALKWYENHSLVRKAPSSKINDKVKIEKSLIPHFGHLSLDALSHDHVESYISCLKKTEVKNTTVNRYLQLLRTILNYHIKRRYISYNAVSIVGLLPKEEGDTFDYLSFVEADQFLRFANNKYQGDRRWVYVLYVFALNTGMRWGEIAALQWDRIDLKNALVMVSRTYCKASKQIRETTKGRKTRHVGINSKLLPELQELYDKANSTQQLLFHGINGKVLDNENFKRDFFYKDLKQAGIRKIRFHDLRHTFASHFMMNDGNLYDLQKLLGHSQIATTEQYAHLSPDSIVNKTELVAMDGGKSNVIPLNSVKKLA